MCKNHPGSFFKNILISKPTLGSRIFWVVAQKFALYSLGICLPATLALFLALVFEYLGLVLSNGPLCDEEYILYLHRLKQQPLVTCSSWAL